MVSVLAGFSCPSCWVWEEWEKDMPSLDLWLHQPFVLRKEEAG